MTKLTIAVATYLRPMDLRRCLPALWHQGVEAGGKVDTDLLVVDNDASGSARQVVVEVETALGAEIKYVVESQPGISAARNRALRESTSSDLLVFVDDDETPERGWLDALLDTKLRTGADAVAGRVVSDLTGVTDPWLLEGRFWARRTMPTGTRIDVAATNNLLLDLHTIRRLGLTFDNRYGLTGGGDTQFTRLLHRAGGRMVWSNEAVVIDHVPAERLTRRWVLARARRLGNSEVVVDIDIAGGAPARAMCRLRGVARGTVRLLGGASKQAYGSIRRSIRLQAMGARTVQRGRGMIDGALGRRMAEYAR